MTDPAPGISDAPAAPPPARRFQLNTHVTADFLARVEPELVSVFVDCLTSGGRRFHDSKISAAMFVAVKLLSVFGLILSLILLAMGGAVFYTVRVDLAFIAIFSLMLYWFWNKDKNTAKLQAFYRPLWQWMARKRASRMLKVAIKTAPFDAEYDFRGDWAAYYRSKNGKCDFAWARRMTGLRLTGSGFTLLFKKEVTIYPYAIVLHDPSIELESHMDALGIGSFVRSASSSHD